jgi:hypothetical protein
MARVAALEHKNAAKEAAKKNNTKKTAVKKTGKTPPPLAESSTALNRDLAIEMHHVRCMVRELTHHLTTNLESNIVRCIELANEIPDGTKRNEEIKKIIKQIHALQIVPEKGKLSDLREIRKIVRSLNTRLEDLV